MFEFQKFHDQSKVRRGSWLPWKFDLRRVSAVLSVTNYVLYLSVCARVVTALNQDCNTDESRPEVWFG